MITINMMSSANKIKGQGVGAAYDEQVALVKTSEKDYKIHVNKFMAADITHYHTIDFKFGLTKWLLSSKGISVGYVHMLPETVETSIKLPRFMKRIFYWYMIRFYKSMDRLVTVNPYFIDVLEQYGVKRDKVTYIPNFVSEKTFYKLEPYRKAAIRNKYGIDSESFVVLCVGQLQTRKGVLDFLKVAERMPDATFVWAGGFSFGNITDGYKEISKIVENPPHNVKFTGIIDRCDMNEIYNMANVMFLPSFEELFPMTILESMSCAVPILIRDLDIYKNILFDFYLKADDVDGFWFELQKLKEDNEYYKNASSLSKKGSDFYSKKHILSLWENFYSNTCKKERKKSAKPLRHHI